VKQAEKFTWFAQSKLPAREYKEALLEQAAFGQEVRGVCSLLPLLSLSLSMARI